MIPRLAPDFDARDAWAVASGPFDPNSVGNFERAFAAKVGMDHCIAFPYGRSALLTLIDVMGWREREIVLPAYTCAAVGYVVLASANLPRLADIGTGDFNMTPAGIAEQVSARTAALIATHMYGFPMDCRNLNLPDGTFVIHDCALAYGACDLGRPVWADADAAFFSFSLGKHLSAVEGGMLALRDTELATAVRRARDGWAKSAGPDVYRPLVRAGLFAGAWAGLHPTMYGLLVSAQRLVPERLWGSATRWLERSTGTLPGAEQLAMADALLPADARRAMSRFQARLGLAQLAKADAIVNRRREIAARYRTEFDQVRGLTAPPDLPGASYSHYPCLVDERDAFVEFLAGRGVCVGTQVFDYLLPDLAAFRPFARGHYTNARDVMARLACLPIHSGLRDGDVARIVDAVGAWSGR